MNKQSIKLLVLLAIAAGIGAFFVFGGGEYFSLKAIKEHRAAFESYYTESPLTVAALFAAAYVMVTALSLPGAAVMTLLAGALFGLGVGIVLASIASTIGATLAFLAARFLLGETVQSRYGERLQKINYGIKREGVYYLFALRLVPIFPFFLINLAMGLTEIKTYKYIAASWLGMLPGTVAYIYAGTALAEVSSLSDVLSADLIAAFVILGLLPLVMKKTTNFWRQKHGKEAL